MADGKGRRHVNAAALWVLYGVAGRRLASQPFLVHEHDEVGEAA